MANIHSISTFTLLFTLLAQILSTTGRAIKSPAIKIVPQKVFSNFPQTITYDINLHKLPKSNPSVDRNGQGEGRILKSRDYNHPSAPGHSSVHPPSHSSADDYSRAISDHSQGAGHAKEKKSRSSPRYFFSASAIAQEKDFRPTAPGISPGAGHAEGPRHCPNDKCAQDFRPTMPGDSPGVGHSFVNNDDSNTSEQAKHLGVASTQLKKTDDYRPTSPGQSPGGGHTISEKARKPNS